MSIKLIAFDMDGTFLNNQHTYDKKRFEKLYDQLTKQNIKFVVASGNQYYQLKSYFPEQHINMGFVAENGAFVLDGIEELFTGKIPFEVVKRVIKTYDSLSEKQLIICGKNSAYVHETVSDSFFEEASLYYKKLKKIPSYTTIDDIVLKFSSLIPVNKVSYVIDRLQQEIGYLLTPISSGQGYVDLIIPGIHKAAGLKLLQQRWNISDEETAAFGDSGNDIEMLQHAAHSFSMENASVPVKEVAKYETLSNNYNGVLVAIEKIFAL